MAGYRAMAINQTGEKAKYPEPLLAKAEQIRLLLLDVDGVLTDGTLLYSENGHEIKPFNTQDGFGLRILQDAGIAAGIITARKSEIVARRARELGLQHLYQGIAGKLTAFKDISAKSGLKPFEIAYMGDDWLDLPLLGRVGLALAPANGVAEVKQAAHFITQNSGGAGAVREACELILRAKGIYDTILQKYQNFTG